MRIATKVEAAVHVTEAQRALALRIVKRAGNEVVPVLGPSLPAGLQQIHHYTSLTGGLGILSTNELWAIHYGHLNDKLEVTHARNLLARLYDGEIRRGMRLPDPVGERIVKRPDELRSWLLYAAVSGITVVKESVPAVASCSTRADNARMWEEYGDGSAGCVVSLRIEPFLRERWWGEGQGCKLFPVTYHARTQRDLMRAIVRSAEVELKDYLAIRGHREEIERGLYAASAALALSLWAYGALCKDRDPWHHEAEWRFLALCDANELRPTPTGKPKVCLRLPPHAVSHVTLGPRCSDEAVEAFRAGLATAGLGALELRRATPK
jgi:hypothetical protein